MVASCRQEITVPEEESVRSSRLCFAYAYVELYGLDGGYVSRARHITRTRKCDSREARVALLFARLRFQERNPRRAEIFDPGTGSVNFARPFSLFLYGVRFPIASRARAPALYRPRTSQGTGIGSKTDCLRGETARHTRRAKWIVKRELSATLCRNKV